MPLSVRTEEAAGWTGIVPEAPATLFIAGRWVPAAGGATFAVDDPATGEELARVADGQGEDALAALDAASTAAPAWAAATPRERSLLLERAFDLVIERRDAFAELMTREIGKPLVQAQGEVDYGAEFLRWFSQEAVRGRGRTLVTPGGLQGIVTHDPVGPSYLITPWNFPLAMGTRKVGAALAAGCTVILKPASATPLTALALARTLEDAGVPHGVVNVVTSRHAGAISEALFADPRLAKVSFTGSTEVGQSILRGAAQHILRTSMELGGNDPFLVFDDADIGAAVSGAMTAKFRNMGQACTAANRFLVQDGVADEFVERMARAADVLKVGNGMEPGVDIGPLIDDHAVERMEEFVEDALARGARLAAGGHRAAAGDRFFEPTILDHVPADARVVREEIFGPVVPITRFATEDEGIRLANDTRYGLAAYAYTTSVGRAEHLRRSLRVGMLGLNAGIVSEPAAPFGGVGLSGLGREGGSEGIMEYLTTKYTLLS